MKPVFWLPFLSALTFFVASCANHQSPDPNDPGYGPFDQFGNYREDWADDPSKWRRPGSRQTPTQDDLPQVAKNEQPPAHANPLAPSASTSTKPAPPKVQSSPRPTTTAKPKPTVVKAKPKPKPQPQVTRYTVKKGDTLSGIASRNRSSVSAIQRANRISGTLIYPGQSLVVPKTR